MGIWTNKQKAREIPSRHNHPWAQLLLKTMQQVEPELVEELTEEGELEAYLTVHVDNCMKEIRASQQAGMEYAVAKELAFENMLPVEPEEIEDWEQEGGEEDAAEALGQWASTRMQDRDETPDEPSDDEAE